MDPKTDGYPNDVEIKAPDNVDGKTDENAKAALNVDNNCSILKNWVIDPID